MVKSLKRICLKAVSLNLNLNYKVCEKHGFKIPMQIGDDIIIYLKKCNKILKNDETRMFKKEVMDFSTFYSQIFTVEYFDFLNNHHLKYLELENLENFNIKERECQIFTKELSLNIGKITKELKDVFKKTSLNVEKKITIFSSNITKKMNSIFFVLNNAKETLQSIEITFSKFTKEGFLNFCLEIMNFKQLKEFSFDFPSTTMKKNEFHENQFDINLSEDQKNFGRKLKILKIPCIFFMFNSNFVKNLTNLELFHVHQRFCYDSVDVNFMVEVFKSLSRQQFPVLKDIYFTFDESNENLQEEFVLFFGNLKNLRYIQIQAHFSVENLKLKLVDYLTNSCDSLQEFRLPYFFTDEAERDVLEKIIGKCTALKAINLDILEYPYNDSVNLLLKLMKNCKSTIEKLDLISEISDDEWFYSNIPKFKRLNYVNITKTRGIDSRNFSPLNKFLTRFFEDHKDTLTKIEIIDYDDAVENSSRNDKSEYFTSISKCYKLESFSVYSQDRRNDLDKIFTNSFLNFNNLQNLRLLQFRFSDKDLEYFLNLFIKLKHLNEAWVENFYISKFLSNQFLRRLECSDVNAESIIFCGFYQENNGAEFEETFCIKYKNYS